MSARRTVAYAAADAASPLKAFPITRRELAANDVGIDIKYCGVCHTDLHQARNDWRGTVYPVVPGHEVVGIVREIGSGVKKFSVGDAVAVGCLVDSCLKCAPCLQHEEQFCRSGPTPTYNGKDKAHGGITYGGYSREVVVREEFVLRVPKGMDLKRVGPILCAGITTYSPLVEWKVQKGDRVGVVGLGGLGHMAVKLAAAIGAEVTVFTTSDAKKAAAVELGAKHVILSKDAAAMRGAANSFDFIIDTVPVAHDLAPYVGTLDFNGTLVIVGAIDQMPPMHSGLLIGGRKRIAGSPIGGIQRTQEVIDFCFKHEVYPDCEFIKMSEINTAFERLLKGDVKYRFVIDMATLEEG